MLVLIVGLVGVATVLTGLGIGTMTSNKKTRYAGAKITIVGVLILLVLLLI